MCLTYICKYPSVRTKTDRPVEYNVIVHDIVRAMVLVSKFGSFPSICSRCMVGSGTPGDESVTVL